MQRLQEQLEPLKVQMNPEKAKVVNMLKGDSFGYLGFDLRRAKSRERKDYYILLTPKKKARQNVKAQIREVIKHAGAMPMPKVIDQINSVLQGWVQFFRVGNSSRAFSEVREYTEMKIRTLLTRRKRRRKRSIGWRRWSNEYLYGELELFWDWKLRPLKNVEAYR